ncbi:hypothetical protein [Sporosarcina sp. USHLN248]|uniref:hypothetical protein n=1 Tax=Sporosarcina sp. USHLN248 TaxID=3081300 RepID=UPI003018B883
MFETEADLVEFFINKRKSKNTKIITELETNFGRPDIVVIKFDPTILSERRRGIYDIKFKRIHSYVLSYLYGKSWVKMDSLNKFFCYPEKRILSLLLEMENMHLIKIKGHLVKSYPAKELLVIKSISTVEAKLTNWKYVIDQAERHLWFTNDSYVLLPRLSEATIHKSYEKCLKTGVGMYIADDKNLSCELKPVKRGKLINTPLLWEINEKIVLGEY